MSVLIKEWLPQHGVCLLLEARGGQLRQNPHNRSNPHNRLRFSGWPADLIEGASPLGDPRRAIDRKPSHVGASALRRWGHGRSEAFILPVAASFATALFLFPFASGCVFGPTALRKTHGRYHEAVKQVQDEALFAISSGCDIRKR